MCCNYIAEYVCSTCAKGARSTSAGASGVPCGETALLAFELPDDPAFLLGPRVIYPFAPRVRGNKQTACLQHSRVFAPNVLVFTLPIRDS